MAGNSPTPTEKQSQNPKHSRSTSNTAGTGCPRKRVHVECDTDLEVLFCLAGLEMYWDKEFLYLHGRAMITFSYTPDGVSLDRLWVPVRYRGSEQAKSALAAFTGFFVTEHSIPVFLTVAPLDYRTQADKLIRLYTESGFRPTGYTNAIGLPEMVCGIPILK